MNIVINRVKVEINSEDLKISFFKDLSNDYKYIYARYKPSNLFKLINENVEIKKWLENLKKPRIRDEEYIYISFLNSSPEYHFQAKLSDLDNALKKKFIKELIIEKLKHKYIIEPFKEGADLCIYKPHEQNDNSVNNFKRYIRYDILTYSPC